MLLHKFRLAWAVLACGLLVGGFMPMSVVVGQDAAADVADGEPPAPEEPAADEPAAEPAEGEDAEAETGPAADADEGGAGDGEAGHGDADHGDADHGDADHGDADHGGADHGGADHGGADHGGADHGGADHGDGGHGGGHAHDNSHSNATDQLEKPEEFSYDLAIWTFVVFALLLLLLGYFAWGPIVDALDAREESISGMIEEAQANAKQAEKQLQAYEQKLEQAADEAREIVLQARKDAEARGEELIAKARDEGDRMIERAKAEIESAKSLAIQELAEESVNTAVSLAGQMIHREVKADDHAQIIRDAIDKFPSKN